MLKDIDKTNIGAIKNVDKAIQRLETKKEKIEESKQKILNKQKEQEQERKSHRQVSRSSKIIQLSDLPKQNDDESDYSIKKKIKSNTIKFDKAKEQAEPKTPSKK